MASVNLITTLQATLFKPNVQKPTFSTPLLLQPFPSFSSSTLQRSAKFNLCTSVSPTEIALTDTFEPELETQDTDEKFDWYSQWYPIAPVCDLDKRAPHGKRVIGIDVVAWWDKNEGAWKVFDDRCPHRLAPLSEGRIDQWGRLQCVYHGWCFNGSGDCKFIPQAPPDGPPVHSFKKACVAAYPCVVQSDILWFWPNSDPEYRDILTKKQPPYIPGIDDPSFTKTFGIREIPYGYEILIENLMDPSHVPYAHYKVMRMPTDKNRPKADREGGLPMEINVQTMDKNGFFSKQERGYSKFVPPCVYYAIPNSMVDQVNGSSSSISDQKDTSTGKTLRKFLLIFICVPVSPGKSRLIWVFPRNFAVWIDQLVPRWMFHINQNLVLDSDLYLLHVEEHKIKEVGPSNWQKACFVPTKSDALVIAFRKWLKKYSGGQVDWGMKFDGSLPPSPPREQLMDRYWSHVVHCSSCNAAYKGLKVFEVALQLLSFGLVGIVALAKHGTANVVARTSLVLTAVICFAFSKWLSHFIYKNFHFHDYNHAFV